MPIALIVLVAGTLAAAAFDLRYRKIPNALTAALFVAALGLHLGDGVSGSVLVLVVMAAAFALGAVAFSAGWFGGGDVKLVAVACGLSGYPGCLVLVVSVLISGAVLALVQAAGQRRLVTFIRSASTLALTGSPPQTRTLVPYGVAIAAGSCAYVVSTLLPLRFGL
jgi:prepilin peptidase CpaA